LRPAMDACRAIKDSDEVELIREANRISSEAHRQVLKQLSHLKTEAEAEGLFLNTCIKAGAKEQAYGPIMGSGPNAGILHYQGNDEAFDDRQVLLIDASCEWQLYAADITRTMPLNKKKPGHWPSSEAKAIYKAVEKVQEACIQLLRPGKRFIDVNWHAIHMTIDALLDLGLLKGDHMEIFHTGTVGAFFPHGLGHHIGLEVHDITPSRREHVDDTPADTEVAEAYETFAKTASPKHQPLPGYHAAESFSLSPSSAFGSCTVDSPSLEPGNVVTIEPGIYFNKFILDNVYLPNPEHRKFIDLDVLERYMPVGGVRIEDDILITEEGYENLTGALKGEEMLIVIRG
jgi:Xaa-Pro dipeptidase